MTSKIDNEKLFNMDMQMSIAVHANNRACEQAKCAVKRNTDKIAHALKGGPNGSH